jgi:hypothetical protein
LARLSIRFCCDGLGKFDAISKKERKSKSKFPHFKNRFHFNYLEEIMSFTFNNSNV